MRYSLPIGLILVATTVSADNDPSTRLDPDIAALVESVSAERLRTDVFTLAGFHTRHTLSETQSDNRGIGAARRWLKAEFERISASHGGRLQVAFDRFQQPPTPPRLPAGAEIVNVVATLPGSDPASVDRVYVVSGHYDSRSLGIMDLDTPAPGANDDGSGTVAVLELARVMAGYEFDATLVFMAVAAEEQGLHGAKHWADTAQAAGTRVDGMLTMDIVGNSHDEHGNRDASHVRLFAEGVPPLDPLPAEVLAQLRTGGENDFPTRQLARSIKETAERYVDDFEIRIIYRKDRYLRGGDHSPFLAAGFPAVRFTEPREVFARQHQDVRVENGVQYGDLPEFVDAEYLAQVTRANAAALANLARAPAAPTGVQIEAVALTNDSTLRWQRGSEPDLAGYRIVWRATTSPFWEDSAWAGDVTRFTIEDVSKDNVIFGVQAVDLDGHVSPAVYPTPWRGR